MTRNTGITQLCIEHLADLFVSVFLLSIAEVGKGFL